MTLYTILCNTLHGVLPVQRAALLLACLPLAGCLPNLSDTVGDAAGRATERAVDRAVYNAVDNAVTAALDEAARGVVGAFSDGAFGDVRFSEDFTLDIFSGSWTVTLSGEVNDVYRKAPTPPTEDGEISEIGIGVRGVNDDGAPFYGLNLVAEREGKTFGLVLLEVRDEGATESEVVQMVSLEVGGVTYAGEAVVTLTEDSSTRIVGGFRAPLLTREGEADTPGALAAEGSFDVPINPAGSLIFTAGPTQPDS